MTNKGTAQVLRAAEVLVKQHMAQCVLMTKMENTTLTLHSRYDPSHDWAHVDRVRKTAMKLAKGLTPTPDLLVVELAALFHDMAAKYTSTSSLPTLLEPFFALPAAKTAITQEQVNLIQRIVPSVSWSTEKKLRASDQWTGWHDGCAELHAVQDADRLDAIGAVGVLRCAAFSGAKGRKLVGEDGDGVDSSAEGHFHDKLFLIKDRMKTKAGRDEAVIRHQTMLDFISRLEEEKARWL